MSQRVVHLLKMQIDVEMPLEWDVIQSILRLGAVEIKGTEETERFMRAARDGRPALLRFLADALEAQDDPVAG